MKEVIDEIIMNDTLFSLIILFLCLILIAIIVMIIRSMKTTKINIYEEDLEDEDIKKVKNVKKEDIIESPNTVKEEKVKKEEKKEKIVEEKVEEQKLEEDIPLELEEKYKEEQEEELKELKEENNTTEIEKLIEQMEEDSRLKPEEVVANFEMEQEAQSIISYQELVNAVKNRKDEYYEDELESKPLSKVSDFIKENDNTFDEDDAKKMIDSISNNSTKDLTNELDDTKFKKTEIISPIFGRIEDTNEVDYPKISKVKEEDLLKDEALDVSQEAALSALNDIYNHMAEELKKSNPKLKNEESLKRYTNNEEFLQSLKDFRKNL